MGISTQGLGCMPRLDRVMDHSVAPLDRYAVDEQRLEVLGWRALRVPPLAPLGAAVVARDADPHVLHYP